MRRKYSDNALKKIGDKVFAEVFKSMQLLNFTVLYGDFDFDTPELGKFNDDLHKHNATILEDLKLFDMAEKKIESVTGVNVVKVVRAFPYRARVKMYGEFPKGDMRVANTFNGHSVNAVYSFCVLSVYTYITENGWGVENIEKWWNKMLEYADLYSKGMTDKFVVDYFIDQIDLKLYEGGANGE